MSSSVLAVRWSTRSAQPSIGPVPAVQGQQQPAAGFAGNRIAGGMERVAGDADGQARPRAGTRRPWGRHPAPALRPVDGGVAKPVASLLCRLGLPCLPDLPAGDGAMASPLSQPEGAPSPGGFMLGSSQRFRLEGSGMPSEETVSKTTPAGAGASPLDGIAVGISATSAAAASCCLPVESTSDTVHGVRGKGNTWPSIR